VIKRATTLALSMLLVVTQAFAGGPLTVTGPAATTPGQPFVWNVTSPIRYTVDTGPLSVNASGQTVVSNAQGLTRVQSLFQNWSSVSTTSIQFAYGGPISVPGVTGGDVKTIQDFNLVQGNCNAGTQSPVIFDANGSLIQALGLDPLVIGFSSPCKLDTAAGHIVSSLIVLNGEFQDGVNNPTSNNYEISADQFDEAITHEMGHFSGLGHSQINLDLYRFGTPGDCDVDKLAGLPLMFPVEFCQSRKSAGLPILAPDDTAWISKLYPNSSYSAKYGTISGFVFFSDGITHLQGLNVIARRVDDSNTPQNESERIAVSVVSGYSFTGNPGQSITGDNTGGSAYGTRNTAYIGYYEIPVTPGTYTVQTENIDSSFTGGSSVGPLDPPVVMPAPNEYWHHYESWWDDPTQADPIAVQAGQQISNINIILNGTPPRFDQYEDGQVRLITPENLFVFRPFKGPWDPGARS
jgi:hypothetical protein